MADKYIHEQEAIDIVAFECGKWTGLAKEISKQLKQMPPADVATIIRCENCQYHSYDEVFCCYWCEHEGMVREVKPNFYCGYGEE